MNLHLLSLAITRTMTCAIALTLFFTLGCCRREKAAIAAETTERDSLKAALAVTRASNAGIHTENEDLKQTARFYYDAAVSRMEAAKTENTDSADHDVIAKFQAVSDKFPQDALAPYAGSNIQKMEERLASRATERKQAEAAIVRLVSQCHSSYANAQEIRARFRVFDNYGNTNYSQQEEAGREASPYENTGYKAKKQAEDLLDKVDDPDGGLHEKVANCGEPD